MRQRSGRRPWTFYALAAFFTLFVLFLYGPMSAIYILSFQGPSGGLTFPMRGVSLNWFGALFEQQRNADYFYRSSQAFLDAHDTAASRREHALLLRRVHEASLAGRPA